MLFEDFYNFHKTYIPCIFFLIFSFRQKPHNNFIIRLSTMEMPSAKKPRVEEGAVQQGPVVDEVEADTEECCICFDTMDGARPVKTLDCKHRFHEDCVQQIERSALPQCCSLCRHPFAVTAESTRKRSIDLHIRLLVHASECTNVACEARTCGLMKGIIDHNRACTVRGSGAECNLCRKFLSLAVLHSFQSEFGQVCPVPHCANIRARRAALLAAI